MAAGGGRGCRRGVTAIEFKLNQSANQQGEQPAQKRPYLTLGYNNYSWAEDDDWVLSVRNDGEEARLYDLQRDPKMNKNVASANREVVGKMWNEYILKDAGGFPPMY